MNVKEILIAARKKIEKPENWTKNYLARDDEGVSTQPWLSDAVCWCSMGAIDSVTYHLNTETDAMSYLRKFMGRSVATFNDSHTHAEVLEAFDKAIASCETAGGDK